MNAVERALRDFLQSRPDNIAIALVGGLAVSARTEPRFTRDLDFAVAVSSDDDAAQYVFQLRGLGYEIVWFRMFALASSAPVGGTLTPLMNEYFASAADVHRILGILEEADDRHPSADGKEKTVAGSTARLARMAADGVETSAIDAGKQGVRENHPRAGNGGVRARWPTSGARPLVPEERSGSK